MMLIRYWNQVRKSLSSVNALFDRRWNKLQLTKLHNLNTLVWWTTFERKNMLQEQNQFHTLNALLRKIVETQKIGEVARVSVKDVPCTKSVSCCPCRGGWRSRWLLAAASTGSPRCWSSRTAWPACDKRLKQDIGTFIEQNF